ncbi:RcnB family protein [Rhizobium puerariae]|uniref:RcnB family protein n=1 Tax=Rhizobium puerariae TaxID=1585791 RepID=A0ABV6A9U3_9HYPH
MKKLFAILISATVLAAPFAAQAQDWRHGPDRHRAPVVEKKVVIKKTRWVKGHRMTHAERRRMAEIRDYRRYRLSAPPRGYRWVRVDNDFLMVGIATGVISSIIAGR